MCFWSITTNSFHFLVGQWVSQSMAFVFSPDFQLLERRWALPSRERKMMSSLSTMILCHTVLTSRTSPSQSLIKSAIIFLLYWLCRFVFRGPPFRVTQEYVKALLLWLRDVLLLWPRMSWATSIDPATRFVKPARLKILAVLCIFCYSVCILTSLRWGWKKLSLLLF